MAANSGGQQPEQTTFLGFPARPEGDGGAVQAGRHCWYELAGEIQGAFADIERAIGGMRWSGDARHAFDAVWSQFSGHATEASQHSHEMGDTLFRIGGQIEDAQHQWDLAMAAMAASTAIGIGLTFLTCSISDDIALGAADAAVGTMTAACTALDISIDAAVQLLIAAVEVAVQLAVKFTWQFTIAVVSQEGANVVQGKSLGNVDLLQAAEFAGVSTLIPGLGKVTIGGRQVLAGVPGAIVTGAATDAAVQGLEGVTEGKPFSVGEVLLSAALAGAGHIAGARLATVRTSPAGGGGGRFPVLNEVPGGAVRQTTSLSCVSACGEMLTGGAVSQGELLATIGEDSNAEALARALGPGWKGGGVDMDRPDAFRALQERGMPWAARVRGQRAHHMVVVDGLTDGGNVMIRDPWHGSRYETPLAEFLREWDGQLVFGPTP